MHVTELTIFYQWTPSKQPMDIFTEAERLRHKRNVINGSGVGESLHIADLVGDLETFFVICEIFFVIRLQSLEQ